MKITSTLKRLCLAAIGAAMTLPSVAAGAGGVPGMYQKLFSGKDVTTGSIVDGGDIISGGAVFSAVAHGNPSISYTYTNAAGQSTTYTLDANKTVGYQGVMMMTAGVTYTFAKNFDDNGHVKITSPDGATTTAVLDNTTWDAAAYGSFTPTATGWHTIELRLGNGTGGVGPTKAPFNADPCASLLWNDAGLTACTADNRAQWHRFVNDETEGTYLYTDIPSDASLTVEGDPIRVGDIQYGKTYPDAGTNMTCTAFDGEWLDAAGTTKATCLGYVITTNNAEGVACEFMSGNTTSCTFTMPKADLKLVWKFAVSNKVEGVESSCLTYDPAEQWIAYGASASVTAVPKSGCTFVDWVSLPEGATKSGTTATFDNVTAPVTVVAACDFTATSIALAEPAGWTGKPVVPQLTVTLGDITLVQDVDFTATSEDIEFGSATATVTGIGTWQGVQTFDFEIVQNPKGPKVTLDKVAQRYPWNGIVDIDYTVSGFAANGCNLADFVISFAFSSASMATNIAYANAVVVKDGSYRISWDLKDLGKFADDATITAKVDLLGAPKASEAEFMLIDMSQTPYAVSYKRGFAGDGAASEAYTDEVYKRTTLVLRKVHAANQTFRMGVGDWYGEVFKDDPEKGKWHAVKLTEDYFLGIFPLTYAQMKLALGGKDQSGETQTSYSGRCMQPIDLCPATKLTDSQVITSITTTDKNTIEGGILGALNAGLTSEIVTLALPTEAQWEYAARNGTRSTYSTGSYTPASNYQDYGWTSETAGDHGHLVATKKHDSWGFYDFIGNVQEYCSDLYDKTGYESGVNYVTNGVTVDPTGPSAESGFTKLVTRGGSWKGQWLYAYHGYRGLATEGYQCDSGLRLKANVEAGGTTGASKTIWTTSVTFALDETFSAFGVLAPTHVNNIQPIRWNSTTNWTLGGDPLTTATLTLSDMTGERTADPATWEAASTVTLASGTDEGSVNWVPSEQRLYRFQLTVGENVASAYFDLTDTEGISAAKPISECRIVVHDAEMTWTGFVLEPRFTVKDVEKELVKGTDYVVVYTAKDVGPATFTVSGLGNYMGSTDVGFTILAPSYTKAAEYVTEADNALDLRGDAERKIASRAETAVAYNDMETFPTFTHLYAVSNGVFATNTVAYAEWPKGGSVGDGKAARISAAPVAEDGTVGAYAVVFEGEGEGPYLWTPKGGRYALKFETVSGTTVTGSFVRIYNVKGSGLMFIIK